MPPSRRQFARSCGRAECLCLQWRNASATGVRSSDRGRSNPTTALTGSRAGPLQTPLSRGHLSRPACSHVKQIAKRPGTRVPGRDFSPAGFLLPRAPTGFSRRPQGGPHVRVDQETIAPKPAWCMPARCARSSARCRRRCSSRRATSTRPRRIASALLRQDPGLRLFALLQPDHEHVREAHGRARRRGSRALDRDRHGGRHHRADGSGAGRRSRRRRQGAVRLLPLGDRGMAAALRRRASRWSTAPTSMQWKNAVRKNTKVFFMETPTNPTLEVYDIAGGRRHRAQRRRQARGRQRVRDAALPEPAQARRRLRGLFGDQAHRRPGPRARRRAFSAPRSSSWTTSIR